MHNAQAMGHLGVQVRHNSIYAKGVVVTYRS